MIKKIYDRMENSIAIQKIRNIMTSDAFLIIQCVIAAVFVSFSSKNDFTSIVYGDILFAVICSLSLIICKDVTATFMSFMLISAMSIKCYDSFDVFIKFVWIAPVFVVALLFHFIVYHKKFELGSLWKGSLLVGIAVTLGGIGKITAQEYFNGTALFYTAGLGLGMFVIYILMNSRYEFSEKYDMRKKFSLIMTLTGLFCVYMILHHYAINWELFIENESMLAFQWRNNASTILMITFPFGFFLSSKKYPFVIAGFLQYIGIILTGSRGGALFGTAEFVLCLIVFLLADKSNRKKNIIVIGALCVILLAFIHPIANFIMPVIKRFTTEHSIRLGLFSRAVEDFKSNPVFGRGLGYMGNTDVHNPAKFALCWYHSAPFQVIGSFGIAGIMAFSYQLYERMRLLFGRITLFNLTLFVSYAGLFMMSLVNPGEFSPIPYGMIATLLFVLCDKNNKFAEVDRNRENVLKIKSGRK